MKHQSDEFEKQLKPTHSFVKSPHFESAVLKITIKRTEDMTQQEKRGDKVLVKKEWSALFLKEKKRKRDNDKEEDEDNHDPSLPT